MQVAILGCGVVGRGTADLLTANAEAIAARAGEPVTVKYILERREIPDCPYQALFVKDFETIVSDPEVSVVIEAMGGSHPAYDFSLRALEAGKHVITSNKEVVANFGVDLLRTAREKGVLYLFEASVGGGIPVLHPLAADLSGNVIDNIFGILNGTTNYILTRMYEAGATFADALAEAQEKGYAEANPAADVEGLDACRKIAILAAIATGTLVRTDDIHTEGITAIRPADVSAASSLGYAIKLLGRMVRTAAGELFLMVAPFFVDKANPLAGISDVFNGVLIHGNFVDNVLFYGRGAGAAPTASAMVGDLMHVATGGTRYHGEWKAAAEGDVTDFSYFAARRYLAIGNCERNSAEVIFGDAEFLNAPDGEIQLLTLPMSEREYEDKVTRLSSCGGRILSHIRILG